MRYRLSSWMVVVLSVLMALLAALVAYLQSLG
jgi:hypothetical protein